MIAVMKFTINHLDVILKPIRFLVKDQPFNMNIIIEYLLLYVNFIVTQWSGAKLKIITIIVCLVWQIPIAYANWPGDYSQIFYTTVSGPYYFDRSNASDGWYIDNEGHLGPVNFGLKGSGTFWQFNVYSAYCNNGSWDIADSFTVPYFTKAGPGQEIASYQDIFSIPCLKKDLNLGNPGTCSKE